MVFCHIRFKNVKNRSGSALIMVLWVLVTIGFLAGEYLSHNRNKANLALNHYRAFERKEAVDSLFRLYNSEYWQMVKSKFKKENWMELPVSGKTLYVKEETEKGKVNLNQGKPNEIRKAVTEILDEEGFLDESDYMEKYREDGHADMITDALMDWMDPDDLVRTNGAEDRYYKDLENSYMPSNGKFKTIKEVFLVKGISENLYFSRVDREIISTLSSRRERDETETEIPDEDDENMEKINTFFNTFTIYGNNVKRVTVLIPEGGEKYYMKVFFIDKGNKVLETLSHIIFNPAEESV